jgi:hypothetical protein
MSGDGRNGYPDRFIEQVALGLVPGFEQFRKFGDNDSVGTSGVEDCWPPGTVRVLPAAAGVVSVVSDDVNDDGNPASTGALTVTIEGLDANYLEISETVTMEGLTPAVTTQAFLRVNRAFVATAGSTETNEGNISCSIGGNLQTYIESLQGQTQQCMYTVPANKFLLITNYSIGVGRISGTADAHIQGEIKLFGGAWRTISNIYLASGASHKNDTLATLAPPKTELRVQIDTTGATQFHAIFAGYLVTANILAIM